MFFFSKICVKLNLYNVIYLRDKLLDSYTNKIIGFRNENVLFSFEQINKMDKVIFSGELCEVKKIFLFKF